MATSTSFCPSGTLADDPVSQPRNMAQPSPTDFFEHNPLDHSQPSIRLLKISPTLSAEGLIQCSISHTTIDHAPYRCLSYAWGEPEPKQLVLIDGKYFYVQPNLFEFLKVIRADTARTANKYWIDAICIDQNNTSERNHQVTQMGNIYSKAETVIAWLGLASNETVLYYHGKLETKHPHRYRKKAVYDDLAGNEYWTRAWITQELILARDISVAIGSFTFTFGKLLEMIRGIDYYLAKTEEVGQVLALNTRSKIVGAPLAELLLAFRNKNCSNPRDRIFSLLALSEEKYIIKVDYGCSVLELVRSIMESNPNTCCACSTLAFMKSLAPEIAALTTLGEFRYTEGPYIEIDATVTDWVHLGEGNKCGVLGYICLQIFSTTEAGSLLGIVPCSMERVIATATPPVKVYSTKQSKSQSFGSSFVMIGPGLGRIRVSLWYLFELYGKGDLQGKRVQLCARPWTGTAKSMTSVRVGYGNWDINAPESPLEE